MSRGIWAGLAIAIALGGGSIAAIIGTQGGGAAAPVGLANIWIDTDGGSCTRQITPTAYSTSTACSTFDTAWDAMNAGDTARVVPGTYGPQAVTGDKTANTYIIGAGDSKDDVVLQNTASECLPVFGAASAMCARAAYMWIENMTLDALLVKSIGSGARIWEDECGGCSAHHVTFVDVDLAGYYPNLYIDSHDFTWRGGSRGVDGYTMSPPICQGGGEPIWVDQSASNTTLDGIRHNPVTIGTYNPTTCDPHIETIRIQDDADNVVIKNNWFVAGSDSGSGHIFTGGSVGPTNVKIINNFFDVINGTYWCQCRNGVNWVVAYNTFVQRTSINNPGTMTWVGNLGNDLAYPDCFGTHIKNVWGGTDSCATDTFIGSSSIGIDSSGNLQSGSPGIGAAETPSTSDYCTNPDFVNSLDHIGDVRPVGTVCDAGWDERVP